LIVLWAVGVANHDVKAFRCLTRHIDIGHSQELSSGNKLADHTVREFHDRNVHRFVSPDRHIQRYWKATGTSRSCVKGYLVLREFLQIVGSGKDQVTLADSEEYAGAVLHEHIVLATVNGDSSPNVVGALVHHPTPVIEDLLSSAVSFLFVGHTYRSSQMNASPLAGSENWQIGPRSANLEEPLADILEGPVVSRRRELVIHSRQSRFCAQAAERNYPPPTSASTEDRHPHHKGSHPERQDVHAASRTYGVARRKVAWPATQSKPSAGGRRQGRCCLSGRQGNCRSSAGQRQGGLRTDPRRMGGFLPSRLVA